MSQEVLKIDEKGWLSNYNECFGASGKSEFFNQRPLEVTIDAIIIHCMSLPAGQYSSTDDNQLIDSGIDRLFTGRLDEKLDAQYYQQLKSEKVSAHLVIYRNGQVKQYVSFLDRAWHAGESMLNGVSNCNDFSIGIELEGWVDDPCGYTKKQYDSLKKVLALLKFSYKIPVENIVGHQDIAPQRKQDPGVFFDWSILAHLDLVT